MTDAEVMTDVKSLLGGKNLLDHREAFRKGALLAKIVQKTPAYEAIDELTESDNEALRHEDDNKWSHPKMLYFLCALYASCAIVQGMD